MVGSLTDFVNFLVDLIEWVWAGAVGLGRAVGLGLTANLVSNREIENPG